MKKLLAAASLTALLFSAGASAKNPTALFYMMETPKSVASFEAHIDKIDLLVPTWYGVDQNGLVHGEPNPYVLKLAKQSKLPVMPIISSDKAKFHALLGDEAAKKRMIATLVAQAKQHGLVGFQFDFENIVFTDRDAFTLLIKQTAEALHADGLKLSIAVVPNAPGYAGRGDFAKWMWEYWRGEFDYPAIAQAVDLFCLMTYDQHTRWTVPGPVGGMPWTVQHLDYALQSVPREKLSLGIATYGYHWFTDNPVKPDGTEVSNIAGAYIDADESMPLAKQYGAQVQWDPVEHESWYYFYRDQMREWVFLPDARAFRDRYDVVKQYGLEGFCAWVLGAEDPKVWEELPDAVR